MSPLIYLSIGCLQAKILFHSKRLSWAVILAAALMAASGCAVRRETRIHPSLVPPPAQEASPDELIARLRAQNESFHTLVASVDFEPTAGSVYSGVIKEYQDVSGFILLEKPSLIRMIGQAPVVHTTVFDMVSDGKEFRLYIPPKQKFIVGKTSMRRPAKNSLENLRPQHVLEALVIDPIDPATEKYLVEQAEENQRRYYVIYVVTAEGNGRLIPKRKIWFDRSNLEIARAQYYEAEGDYVEDVWYSDYKDFDGVHYPAHIELLRPVEDYRLTITIAKATFNQPLSPEKFELKKPESAQLVDLSTRGEDSRGQ